MRASDKKGALAGAPENHEVIGSVFLIGVSSIVSKRTAQALLAALTLGGMALAGCGPESGAWRGEAPPAPDDPAADAGYLRPPQANSSRLVSGQVVLSGLARADAEVRLGSPTGEVLNGRSDAQGAWTVRLPASQEVRLFGLSMDGGPGGRVQAQGYLAVLPDGRSAELRSGTSAMVIAPPSDPPRLLAVDFDRDGALTVAGLVKADAGLSLRIDRTAQGATKADHGGRFDLVIDRPVAPGRRTFEIAGETGEQTVVVPIGAADPLDGPFRAARVGSGWRIDWITPGGGVQSTVILDPAS
jgi:hypothetical protein